MMNNLKAINRAFRSYIASCRANGLAKGTVANYERVVGEYINFLNENEYDTATAGSATDWKIQMSEKGTKINVIASKMGMVKAFFTWAVEMELLQKNPFLPSVMPSRKAVNVANNRPYEHVLTTEDFTKILHCGKPSRITETSWLRSRAIIILFLTSALRNSELRALRPCDLDFKRGCISVEHGKGDKARIVAMPKISQLAIKEYLMTRPNNLTDTDYLFGILGDNGEWKQFTRHYLSAMVERTVYLITGKHGYRSHSLRHGCATQYYERGLDIGSISDLLGHSNVATTQIYIEKLSPEVPTQKANELFDDEIRRAL